MGSIAYVYLLIAPFSASTNNSPSRHLSVWSIKVYRAGPLTDLQTFSSLGVMYPCDAMTVHVQRERIALCILVVWLWKRYGPIRSRQSSFQKERGDADAVGLMMARCSGYG